MAVNLTEKYAPLIDERFKLQSITDKFAGKKYDWDGARTIQVYSVDPVTLNNYDRTGASGRFGTPTELGDRKNAYMLGQDRSFTFIIDHGNAADQMNIKRCNEQLKSNWDEVCTPEIDKYRFLRWCNGAGCVVGAANALTDQTVVPAIMTGAMTLSNHLVPKANRACFIRESVYIKVKLSAEILGIDTLGRRAVQNGVVGFLDGMAIVPVPDSYLPEGVNFLIKYRDATADPMKLKVLRVQHNPVGIDGDVGECRFYHDAFVLSNKVDGLYVHAASANVTADPVITVSSGSATITCSTAGATIKYTVDGTDPKVSDTAQTYAAAVSVSAGTVVRACAAASGKVTSNTVNKTA